MKIKEFTFCAIGIFILLSLSLLAGQQADQAKSHFDKGFSYLKASEFEKAAQEFQKAIELDPTNKVYHSALGDAYMGMEKYEDAIKAYEKSSELDASWNWPVFRIGLCYYQMDKKEDALLYLNLSYDMGYEKAKEYIDKLEGTAEKVEITTEEEEEEKPVELPPARRSTQEAITKDDGGGNFCPIALGIVGAGGLGIAAVELFGGGGTDDSDLTGLWTLTIVDNQSDYYGDVYTWIFYGNITHSDSTFSGSLSPGFIPGYTSTFSGTATDSQLNLTLHVQSPTYTSTYGTYTYYYTYDFNITLNKSRSFYYTGTSNMTEIYHKSTGSTTTWNYTGFTSYLSVANQKE